MSKARALELENERLRIKMVKLEAEVARLSVALQATIAEKERIRQLAVDYSCKADGLQMDLQMCQNMKLAREFENLLETTSIPVAVKKVKALMEVAEAAREYLDADGSITAKRLYDALAGLEGAVSDGSI